MYTQIKDLYIKHLSLNVEREVHPSVVNHIWIIDVSLSMTHFLPKLVEDVILHSRNIGLGSAISIAWFSGPGSYNFFLKGFEISSDKSYRTLEAAIRKNMYPRNITCFSEVLFEANEVLEDMIVFGEVNNLVFFTDGYPVVPDYDKEISNVFTAIGTLSQKLDSVMLVGYGDWYNRKLMSDMAHNLGGSLIHSNSLADFTGPMSHFVNDFCVSRKNYTIGDALHAFSIYNGQIVNYKIEGRCVNVPLDCDSIYVIYPSRPPGHKVDNEDFLINGYLGAAKVLIQNNKVDQALDILAVVGDKSLIDAAYNAWTVEEYGKLEYELTNICAGSASYTFKGQKVGRDYVPAPDAFCVLDVMELLQGDDEAYFYPYNKAFKYKRIGAVAVREKGYPDFFAPADVKCRMSDLVWNRKRLNLSVRARIEGSIELDSQASEYGFGDRWGTYIWRNYTVIKDGTLNTTILPVSMSKASFSKLFSKGVLGSQYKEGKVFFLHLDRIPVINRVIADDEIMARDLCELKWEELVLKGKVKAFKYYRDILDPERKLKSDILSDDQIAYLESQGIGRHGFSPSVKAAPSGDFYMAHTFELKVARYSSLPTVVSVISKMKDGKNQTSSGELVYSGVMDFGANATLGAELQWLEGKITQHNKEIRAIQAKMARTMFTVLLAKKWFVDLTRDEKNVIMVDGKQYTITIKEEKIWI